jgi:uncharacterized GH25 family protein
MPSASKWAIVFLSAIGLGTFAISTTNAEPTTQPSSDVQSAVGTITGTVLKDGKPVANARVGLIDRSEMKARLSKRAKGQGADGASADQKQRPTPIATTTTDSEGKFSINDVKVGDYVVMAGGRGEGRGRAMTSVASGQTANVEIQISANAGGGKGAGKAAKAAKAT